MPNSVAVSRADTSAPKVGFVSLGCPKALVDSERILTQLRTEGYVISPSYQDADVVVVNTCGFIDSAKAESLGATARYLKHVAKAYTIGEAGPLFAQLLRAASVEVVECGTLDQAVKAAAAEAQPGDTVLLSPACASFDQFKDFEARGDAFRAAVEAL